MPRLGPYMKSDLTELYAASDFVQMFQGVGGTLDNLMTIPIYRMLMQGKVGVQILKHYTHHKHKSETLCLQLFFHS
jgi:hypothetical protein